MMPDADAREVLHAAFAVRGISPNARALQGVQAIGRFEGNYGAAFGGANNWGAVQCKSAPPCPPDCVELTDTHADGTKYQWCYRIYPTPVEGAADLVRELYRRPGVPQALASGNATAIAERMREAGYFEAPASRYAKAIEGNAQTIAGNIPEPWVVKRGATGTLPTRKGTDIAGPILFALGIWGIARWRVNAQRTRYRNG